MKKSNLWFVRCTKKAKCGLNICGYALVDVDRNNSFHLNTIQTSISKKHTNFALTTVCFAKIDLNINNKQHGSLSMANYKTMFYKELLLNRFISNFAINPNTEKNKRIIQELI